MPSFTSLLERCRRPICLCSDWVLWFSLCVILILSLLVMDWQALPFMPREEKTLHLFVEDAYSITKGSPVVFMGVKVGYITRVFIDPYYQSVAIDYALDNPSLKIPDDADALIVAAGLGGAKSLEFTLHDKKVSDDEVIPSRITQAHVTQPFRQKTMWQTQMQIARMLKKGAESLGRSLSRLSPAQRQQRLNTFLIETKKAEQHLEVLTQALPTLQVQTHQKIQAFDVALHQTEQQLSRLEAQYQQLEKPLNSKASRVHRQIQETRQVLHEQQKNMQTLMKKDL